MKPTRAERRARLRAEQEKVAPGTGLKVRLARGTWMMGGGKAGEWKWLPGLCGLAAIPLVWLVLGLEPSGLVGAVLGFGIVLGQGYWVHRRYVSRTAAGHEQQR